ncbi:MAG TPA: OsmC family protein [Chitinophagaceae bacterium]|nr:OsmC family protein [Chitinophagaceae bacterium]
MATEHYYDVQVKWNNGRIGTLTSAVLDDAIEVATPPEFTNGVPGIWSPEHLLVAAVNSCLMTTFLAIADNSKLNFTSFISKATGKLEVVDGKYMISEITLMPEVAVPGQADLERATRVLQKAEANCLISNSVKAKIIFNPRVVTELPELV